MITDKIIILDKRELTQKQLDCLIELDSSIVSYIESNNSLFFYLEDIDFSRYDDDDSEQELKSVRDIVKDFALANNLTGDIKILLTL